MFVSLHICVDVFLFLLGVERFSCGGAFKFINLFFVVFHEVFALLMYELLPND